MKMKNLPRIVLATVVVWLLTAVYAPAQDRPSGDVPADLHAYIDGIVLANGTHVKTHNDALAEALELSQPGDVIALYYASPRLSVSVGDPNHRHVAHRPTPFLDVTIVPGNTSAEIRHLALGESGGGWDGLVFDGMRFDFKGSQAGVLGYQGTVGGRLEFRTCTFESNPNTTKWVLRLHNSCGPLVLLDCALIGGSQEHGLYADNVQGANIGRNTFRGHRRTGIQIVDRWWAGNGPHQRGGSGPINIWGNLIEDCGADGASAITVAGHGGPVYIGRRPNGVIRPNTITSRFKAGAIVVYRDDKQYQQAKPNAPAGQRGPIVGPGYVIGAEFDEQGHLTAHGWAVQFVEIVEQTATYQYGDRNIMGVGAVERLRVVGGLRRRDLIQGPKTALEIAQQGQPCGQVELVNADTPPSEWPWQVPWKVRSNGVPMDEDSFWVQERP